MNYEFHVGDYVENKNGSIGYIVKIEKTVPYWEVTKHSDVDVNTRTCCMNIQYPIPLEDIDFGGYVRIGQYDFTKKDKDKIERLDYTERFIRESTVDTTLVSYMKKINELVETVNRLEEKVNEMAH